MIGSKNPTSAASSTPVSAGEALSYALRLENAAVAVTILYGRTHQPAAEMMELLYCYVQGHVLSDAQRVRFQQLLRTTPYRFSTANPSPLTACSAPEAATAGLEQAPS